MFARLWVWILAPYTGWTFKYFSHWFVVKIVLFVWKDQKETWVGSFLIIKLQHYPHDDSASDPVSFLLDRVPLGRGSGLHLAGATLDRWPGEVGAIWKNGKLKLVIIVKRSISESIFLTLPCSDMEIIDGYSIEACWLVILKIPTHYPFI